MLMKRIRLLWLLLMLMVSSAFTPVVADEITINDGDTQSKYTPVDMYNNSSYTRNQFIIPSGTLNLQEGVEIEKFEFYSNKNSLTLGGNYKLNLMVTQDENFSTTSFLDTSDAETVYSGTLSVGSDGKIVVEFSTSFVYSGGNLLVELAHDQTGNVSTNAYFYGVYPTGYSSLRKSSFSTPITTGTRERFLPKMTIGYSVPAVGRPKNFAASDIAATSATLSWDAVNGVDGYDLYYSTTEGAPEDGASGIVEISSGTSYSCTGLTAERTYYAYVRAKSGTDVSKWASCKFLPTANKTITINDGTQTNGNLPVPTQRYGNYIWTQFIIPSATLAGLQGSEIKQFVFYHGNSYEMVYDNYTLNLWITNENSFTGSEFLTSSDSQEVYSGSITVGADGKMTVDFKDKPFEYTGGNLLVEFKQKKPSGSYSSLNTNFYGISSENAGVYNYSGISWPTKPRSSSTESFLPKMTITYEVVGLGKPKHFAASDVAVTSATLSWDAVNGADGYDLYYSTTEGAPEDGASGIVEVSSGTSYSCTGLTHETTYYAYVRAKSGTDASKWAVCNFTTTAINATQSGFTFKMNPEGTAFMVTGYDDSSAAPTVPASVSYNGTDYPVTSIAADALKNHTALTEITIPASITSIGAGAFSGCTGVTLVNFLGTTPPTWADGTEGQQFNRPAGTNILVPSAAKQVYKSQYTAWADVIYSGAAPTVETFDNFTYKLVPDVENGTYTAIVTGTSLTSGEMTIPATVTGADGHTYTIVEIGSNAFSGKNGLTAVTIPAGVTAIGAGAFNGCTGVGVVNFLGAVPTWADGTQGQQFNRPAGTDILVPSQYLSDYKTAYTAWADVIYTGTIPAVRSLTASNVTKSSAKLTWKGLKGHNAWQVAITTDENASTASLTPVDVTTPNYTFTGLDQKTTYYAYVRDNVGEGSDWSPVSFTTMNETVPVTYCLTKNVGLTISQVWDAGGIKVVNHETGNEIATLKKTSKENPQCQTIELECGVTYDFIYQTVYFPESCGYTFTDSEGNTIAESTSCSSLANDQVIFQYTPQLPLRVDNLEINNITTCKATAEWTARTGQTAWQVAYTSDSNALPSTLETHDVTSPSYQMTGLTRGTQYYVYVRALDGEDTAWGRAVTFTCLPSSVDDLTVSNIANTSATLTWTGKADQTQWKVALTTNPYADPATLTANTVTSGTFNLTGLKPGSKYYAYVCPVDGALADEWTDAQFTTTGDFPVVISPISEIAETEATVTWTDSSTGASAWQIAYTTDRDADPNTLTPVNVTSMTYQMTDLNPSQRYYVYVRNNNGAGSSWSAVESFVTQMAGLGEALEGPVYINGTETVGAYYRRVPNTTDEVAFYYETAINGDIRIPDTFESNGVTYKVTQLGKVPAGVTAVDMSGNDNLRVLRDQDTFTDCGHTLKTLDFSNCKNLSFDNFGKFGDSKEQDASTHVYVNNDVYGILSNAPSDVWDPRRISALESVNFSGCTSITRIPGGFFRNVKSLKNVDFSNCKNLSIIGNSVFYNGGSLGTVDFSNCTSLTENSFQMEYVEFSGNDYQKAQNEVVYYPAVFSNFNGKVEKLDFSGCTGFTTLPAGIVNVPVDSLIFENCTSLSELQLDANGMNFYWSSADIQPSFVSFKGCSNLTTIGNSYFQGVESATSCNLKEIDLTDCLSLMTIGDYAFNMNPRLEYVNLTGCTSLTTIGKQAFYENVSLKNIDLTVSEHLSSIGEKAFSLSYALESIDVRGNDLVIGKEAFFKCGTTLVNLREGVKELGAFAIAMMPNLTHVNMPSTTLKTIGYGFLYACDQLESLVIPASVELIDGCFLWGCSGLRNVYLLGQPSVLKTKSTTSYNNDLGSFNKQPNFYGGKVVTLYGDNSKDKYDAVHDCVFWVNDAGTYCDYVKRAKEYVQVPVSEYVNTGDPQNHQLMNVDGNPWMINFGQGAWLGKQKNETIYANDEAADEYQWRQLDKEWTRSAAFAEVQKNASGFYYTQFNNRYNNWGYAEGENQNTLGVGNAYRLPYSRTLAQYKWATICFPFGGESDFQSYLRGLFGEEADNVIIAKYVEAEQRQTYENGLYHLTFQRVRYDELLSDYPYVIYSPKDVTIDMLHGHDMATQHWTVEIKQAWEVSNEPGTTVTMIGNYINPMYLRSNVYFLQSYTRSGQPTMRFVKTATWGTSWVPDYRCYFEVTKGNGSVLTHNAMGYMPEDMIDENDATVIINIEEPETPEREAISGIYTLNGMKLNATSVKDLPRGIYIVNGKKVAVK